MRDVSTVRSLLIPRTVLDHRGMSSQAVTAAIARGTLIRVHAGWYVEGELWRAGFAEDRHLIRVVAAHAAQRGTDAVAVLASAAVLHGFPLYRWDPERVHTAGERLSGHVQKSPWIARHEFSVGMNDRVLVGGIACTSPSRTVADLLRTARPEVALSVADAALRRVAWDDADHSYDEEAAAAFRAEVFASLHRTRGARGVRQGRWLLDLADGRAQLPLETVSRLRLIELGFARPRLQVRVPGPSGSAFYVDLGLDDVAAWGECDGDGKYLEEARRQGKTLEEVLLAEKQREDWIRGTTRRPVARWGSRDVVTASALGRRLAAFQIRAPR